jgi:hypothetical protein
MSVGMSKVKDIQGDVLYFGHPHRNVKNPGGNVTHIPMGDYSPIFARLKCKK